MRHCPNPDCSQARSTGRPAEYRDHVADCADCGSELVDGAAPEPPMETESFELVAKFSSAHEAHMARAALESHGIEAIVDQDHSPLISMVPWVQLRVPRSAVELTRRVLERGPLRDDDASVGRADAPAPPEMESALVDDMRPLRLSRRFLLARWFLYGEAVSGFLAGFALLGTPILSLASWAAGTFALVLALWSWRRPRDAFAVGVGFQTLLTVLAIVTNGLNGLIALIPNLALYFAWAAAGDHPPEILQVTPEPTRSADTDIGDAWKAERPAGPGTG